MRTDLEIFMSFTDAERRLFVLIGACHLNHEIAEKEKLSIREVKIRIWRLCERFMPPNEVDQVQSRYRLVCIWETLSRKVIIAADGSMTMRSEELPAPKKVRKVPDMGMRKTAQSKTKKHAQPRTDTLETPATALDLNTYMDRVHLFGRMSPYLRRVAEAMALNHDSAGAAAHYGKDTQAFYSDISVLSSNLKLRGLRTPDKFVIVRAIYQEWLRIGAPVEVRKTRKPTAFPYHRIRRQKARMVPNVVTSK